MGFYFRKGISVGGLRINLSKSGIGYSYGIKGFRISAGPRGTYATAGSHGFCYRERLHKPAPKQFQGTEQRTGGEVFETADVSHLVDSSSAKVLSEINNRKERTKITPFVAGAFVVVAAVLFASQAVLAMAVVSIIGVGMTLAMNRIDYQKRTTSLTYELEGAPAKRFDEIKTTCQSLSKSHRIWRVQSRQANWDWKRNAGASSLINRRDVNVGPLDPPCIETNAEIWGIDAGDSKLYFFPDYVFVLQDGRYGAVSYESLRTDFSPSRFIEDSLVPKDAQIVDHTWKYVRRDGGPDKRFSKNRQLPIALYAHLAIMSPTGLNIHLQISSIGIAQQVSEFFGKTGPKPSREQGSQKTKGSSYKTATRRTSIIKDKTPYGILGVSDNATSDEIAAAYREKAQMYHPDKVATLAAEFRELAERKMKEINIAYDTLKKRMPEQRTDSPQNNGQQSEEDGESIEPDNLYYEALRIVTDLGRASTSVLQRRLEVNYRRATTILDQMERDQLVGPADGYKPRKVLQIAYEKRKQVEREHPQEDNTAKEELHTISAYDLFPPDFMKSHTDFETIDAMFDSSGLRIETTQDIEATPEGQWDAFVYTRTKFTSWHQMKKFAVDEYCYRHGLKGRLK